ncbi:hypothetical protein VTL71DRAFT_9762 [Oculimacula yallundae]|uniref:FAD/NAD(P)-binding domain-containing protein n=1 Tax=Oculimacula yallundae TaxID=86028 RepID=A0ABR4BRR9_9HELO
MASVVTNGPKRVVVIGAGWAGLVAAKTYLEIDPKIHLTIFDCERTLGGVWNADRCFPGFLADSPSGLFDYSDLPMREAIGLKDWSDLPGDQVYRYLKAYAEKFSLVEKMRLSTKIKRVARNMDMKAWDLEIEGSGEIVTCDKLLLATGLNSKPTWPNIPLDDFDGLAIHSKDIGLRHVELLSEKVKRVAIYGGGKSAIDAVDFCVNAGKHVDWIIRETGNGAGMMIQVRKRGVHGARLVGRYKNILTPSIFSTGSFWYRFLHSGKSRIGDWLVKKFWSKASTVPLSMSPYDKKCSNMEKLQPETKDALFFTASLSALHGQKKFVDELHFGNLIQVHRATITSMTGSGINMNNGESLPCDAAIFATGWEYMSTMFDPAESLNLGSPAPLTDEDPETTTYWEKLRGKAEKEVLDLLPILKNPPPHHPRKVEHTPYRLYRHILPSNLAAQDDRSLIFLGLLTSIQTSIYAEVSALWGVSWMEGLLDISKSKEEMDYDIAKVNSWCERRYLARGRTRQIASAEIQDVTDLLMRDMGLKVYRKSNMFSETFLPGTAQDYKGIVQEMLSKTSGVK